MHDIEAGRPTILLPGVADRTFSYPFQAGTRPDSCSASRVTAFYRANLVYPDFRDLVRWCHRLDIDFKVCPCLT